MTGSSRGGGAVAGTTIEAGAFGSRQGSVRASDHQGDGASLLPDEMGADACGSPDWGLLQPSVTHQA